MKRPKSQIFDTGSQLLDQEFEQLIIRSISATLVNN